MSVGGQNFALGAKVYLKTCPGAGVPGTVTGEQRGKVLVHWADLNFSGSHRAEALEIAPLPLGRKDERQ